MMWFKYENAQGRLLVAEFAMSGQLPSAKQHASPKDDAADLHRIGTKLRRDLLYSSTTGLRDEVYKRPVADMLPIWC